ncbi:MAG: septum formation inhibitor Maf [Bacteroidetes bacterium]|nr:septum formation inhibitor Maf [Bacteroidota bacterium]
MNRINISLIILSLLFIGGVAVAFYPHAPAPAGEVVSVNQETFNGYWRQGKAELLRYELAQERYGEIREGEAVLVSVIEPFLPVTQVKYEGLPADDAAESVLKMIFTRRFHTGIYPYSMMTTVFTPLGAAPVPPYKVTATSQEWCGHTFTQVNHRDNVFEVASYSYFQDEGDERFTTDVAVLEDELWTRIRLRPSSLPTGTLDVIPRLDYQRMRHARFASFSAMASLTDFRDGDYPEEDLMEYVLTYHELPRTVRIRFQRDFPHRVLTWEEEMRDPSVPEEQWLVTRGRLAGSMMSDYWNRSSIVDSTLRHEFGLRF